MLVSGAVGELGKFIADGLLLGVFEDGGLDGAAAVADAALAGALSELRGLDGLSGKPGTVTIVHTLGALGCRRIAAVGLGPRDGVDVNVVRRAYAAGWQRLRAESAAMILAALPPGDSLDPQAGIEAVVEGCLLEDYRFAAYLPEHEQPAAALTIWSDDDTNAEPIALGIVVGQARAEATNFARELVNTAPSDLPPSELCEQARVMAAQVGLQCTILGDDELAELGADLILAVNRGSQAPAALIVLEHRGGGDEPALGLVGKGVCFDSGGLSIKSGDGMMTMKSDMGGAAAVLGAMMAIARLELPLNVTGLIPTVQNLVDAGSVKPGDVVRGLGGKTVEILNTDAEGRLILADALAYATGHLGLRTVVDIATLTGACMRALGPIYGGLFATDDELAAQVAAAGRQGGEKLWRLPLDDEYAAMMQSPIADLRNISTHAGGGASTAAEFLKAFVGEASWAHLDIAGLGLTSEAKPGQPKGATGYGTRTLINLAMALAEDA